MTELIVAVILLLVGVVIKLLARQARRKSVREEVPMFLIEKVEYNEGKVSYHLLKWCNYKEQHKFYSWHGTEQEARDEKKLLEECIWKNTVKNAEILK